MPQIDTQTRRTYNTPVFTSGFKKNFNQEFPNYEFRSMFLIKTWNYLFFGGAHSFQKPCAEDRFLLFLLRNLYLPKKLRNLKDHKIYKNLILTFF